MAGVREKRGQARRLRAVLWLVAVLHWQPGLAQQGKPQVPPELPPQAAEKAKQAVEANTAPTTTLIAPVAGALYTAPAGVVLEASATASSSGRSITQVEFFAGATLIGSAHTAPYRFNWSNVVAGAYNLTAKATDNIGVTSTSAPVAIIVNAPPTVNLESPGNNAVFNAPATIPLFAQALDADGTIARVEFYNGTSLIAALTAPPYSINWLQVPQGSYSLSARVTDNLGATTTSTAVTVTVNTVLAQIYYIHTDHLNTPRAIYDQQQRLVWRWDNTDPFGGNPPNENPSGLGNFTCNLRLPGQYFDRETNLHYNYFRDYDPVAGRYVQSDPLGLVGGVNTYAYVRNNPLSFRDPSGLDLTVTYYPGSIVDHIGIGVNSPITYGHYPRDRGPAVAFCREVPGRISQDRYVQDAVSQSKAQSIVIKTTPAQDAMVHQFIEHARTAAAQNTLTYNLCSDQCTRFVIDALSSGGVGLPRLDSARPKDLYDILEKSFGPQR